MYLFYWFASHLREIVLISIGLAFPVTGIKLFFDIIKKNM